MLSFKKAAIKILESEGKPLNYRELTRMAIEQNLIETSGATPENTMNAVIGRDINYNKSDSPFLRDDGKGMVELRPDYKKFLTRDDYDEEEDESEDEPRKETTNRRYIGSAGEHRVASELLFLGYNVNSVSVDYGIDLVAIKGNNYFNIQVKTANENSFKKYSTSVRKTAFDRFKTLNTFYIFVLRRTNSESGKKEADFLILPYSDFKQQCSKKNIRESENIYTLTITYEDGKIFLGSNKEDVTYYLNKWDQIGP